MFLLKQKSLRAQKWEKKLFTLLAQPKRFYSSSKNTQVKFDSIHAKQL